MAEFKFEAKGLDGKIIRGTVVSSSEVEARAKLRSRHLVPLKIISEKDKAKKSRVNFFSSGTVKPKELQTFTRQFSILISAGVPVVECLETMTGGRGSYLDSVLTDISGKVESGFPLTEAMKTHSNTFDRLYVNLVHAGEEGGVLDGVLRRLAEYIEKSVKLKSKITGAMWYPVAILVISVLVITGILIFVVPTFEKMFSEKSLELPAITQFVMGASNFIQDRWYLILGLLIVVPMLIGGYYRTKEGRYMLDGLILKVPLFGELIKKNSIAKFSRTLSTLLESGVPLIESLEISTATSGNVVLEKALLSTKESLRTGGNLTDPLKNSPYIPGMVAQIISVGEKTGSLDIVLNKIADFYEDEVEVTAESMTSLIEPILMAFLGGIVGTLVLAMYLPIFELASVVA